MIESCCPPLETTPGDFVQLFVFGLLMSAGHCLGMCGPLACAASVPAPQSGWSCARWALTYHGGRVVTYASLGALLGTFGLLVPDRASTSVWQASLSFLAAAALLWIGLALFDLFPLGAVPFASRLSRAVATRARRARGKPAAQFGLGMANGLLPCGPVYTALVAAWASGGPLRGAFAMTAFGAGTVPMLFALAFGMRWIGERVRVGFHRAGAAFTVAMAVQLALRGLAALEVVPHARIREVTLW